MKYTPYTKLKGNYEYVWGDEFDSDTLDTNKWTTKVTKMTGRNVLLVDDDEKVIRVKDSALILTAYKDEDGVYHVPTSVHTKTTMNYLYGYAEIRAKLPLELGCFASFWTRGVSDVPSTSLAPGNLDHYAEVDMFEVFRNGGKQCVGGNILKNFPHDVGKGWFATPMDWTQQVILPDEEYHIYGYEWTPDEINLYFDGEIYAHFDTTTSWTENTTEGRGLPGWNKDTTRFSDKSGTDMRSFNEAQYLIFNHHLHHKDAFLASASVTENESYKSADYVIDYCRIFQKKDGKLYTK